MPSALHIYSPEVAEQILQNSQKSITFVQADGVINYTNSTSEKLFGSAVAKLIGKSIYTVLPSWSIQHQLIADAIEKGIELIDEISLNRSDKSTFVGQIRLMFILDSKKNRIGTLLIITDLNKRIAYRESLTQKINTLEQLTKSRFIRDGKLEEAIHEILEKSAKAIQVERINAWLIDEDFTCIESIGNYNSKTKSLVAQEKLYRSNLPEYFKLLQSEEIIVLNDTLHDKRSIELVKPYLTANKIVSMMDVPIRIEGKMVGVVCFEHTKKELREWDLIEQKFGLFVSQLISLALETHSKQLAKKELEESLKEKEVLLSEIHHRVKNNLSIISSLINLQAAKAKDSFHSELFLESKNMVHTIAEIHHLLYESQNFSHINFKNYLEKIIDLIRISYENPKKPVVINMNLEDVFMAMSKAIPCGLIVNELITNCYKHAFKSQKNALISISLKEQNGFAELTIQDNGIGMESFSVNKNTLGIAIVQDLAKQIEAQINYSNAEGSIIKIVFQNSI